MQFECQTSVISTAEEVERLKAAELEAEKRHGEAMHRGDLAAARIAADDWIKACDVLTEYVAAHPDLYRDTG
jgi:hypothetical protein